nr:receptor-like serine/threonine-protein kinase SD1-7 [Ipomoea trifida]
MKLGWFGLKTGQPHQRFLTSWTNQQNPSPGAFTFGVLYPNNTKLVLMRRGIVYWQSGVWNGTNFPFLPYLNFTYFSDENQSYFILNDDQDDLAYYTLIIHAIGEVSVETNGYNRSVFDCYNKEWADSNGSIQQLVSLMNGNNICITSRLVSLTVRNCVQKIVLATPMLLSMLKLEQDANFLLPLPTIMALTVKLFTFASMPKQPQMNIQDNNLHSRQQPAGKEDDDLPFFNFKSIEMATNYFSTENKLGQGGFGPVYKVWTVWIEGRISELIDPTMDKTVSLNEAIRCIQVGLLCVQDSAADRPTMSDVVSMLGNELIVLPTPKQPGFSTIIGLRCDDIGNNPGVGSINMVTISDIEGR